MNSQTNKQTEAQTRNYNAHKWGIKTNMSAHTEKFGTLPSLLIIHFMLKVLNIKLYYFYHLRMYLGEVLEFVSNVRTP